MYKNYSCLVFILFLFYLNIVKAQTTYVPDNNFEQALIDLGYDDVLDDYVHTVNISNIVELNISNKNRNDSSKGLFFKMSLIPLSSQTLISSSLEWPLGHKGPQCIRHFTGSVPCMHILSTPSSD